MKQVLIQRGRAVVRDVPSPACGEGEVLVRVAYSLISTGTETATLGDSATTPAGTWTRRARKIGEVARMVPERGLRGTVAAVKERLAGPCTQTGYSLAGTVVAVGESVRDLVPGQRVACAGAAAAHHAEIVAVPRNLTTPVPETVPLERAAFVTLGAIALQGIRQADLRLGEIAFVTGLGLVGQLTVALLRASGCRVLGADLSPERVDLAVRSGLDHGAVSGRDDVEGLVREVTAGRGVDAALITAATSSPEPLRQAVRLVRDRGRVVLVGAVGMELERQPLFAREAEVRISRSYGPGRYDPSYEHDGVDYPYGYVRWTENRNMQEFLRLVAEGRVRPDALPGAVVDVDNAEAAYRSLAEGSTEERPLAVLLRYPDAPAGEAPALDTRVAVVASPRPRGLGVALVGPGAFASAVHLPNVDALKPAAHLRAVVGRTANAAREAARRWAGAYAATDLDEVLADSETDLVIVATRHDLHADQAARALEAGKAVYLEKPAALDRPGLERLADALRSGAPPFTLGLNRRFAPDVRALIAMLERRRGPLVIDYRVNAGRLPADHWALGPEGGGRLVGEACHMIDLLGHLVGRPRREHCLTVLAPQADRPDLPVGDNFSLSLRYADGSVAQLLYTSRGSPDAGKERIEAHWDGTTAVIDDFRGLEVSGAAGSTARRAAADKGHLELLRLFVEHASGRGAEPIPRGEILDVSRFVLDLDREARGLDTGTDRLPSES